MIGCHNIHALLHDVLHGCFVTGSANQALISSTAVLSCDYARFCYVLDAQLLLHAELIPHRVNAQLHL